MRDLRTAAVCVALAVSTACGGDAPEPAAPATPAAIPAAQPAGEEGHHHTAPHGGALLELGEHFSFLELVVDPATGRVTLYVLDGEAEKAVRVAHPNLTLTLIEPAGITASLTLEARASTLTGETVGDSSEFVGVLEALKGANAVKARLATIVVKGQTFDGLELVWPGTE